MESDMPTRSGTSWLTIRNEAPSRVTVSRMQRIEHALDLRMHAGERLVHQHEARPCHQRAGELEQALLAAGQLAGGVVGVLLESDEGEQLRRAAVGGRALASPPGAAAARTGSASR